MRRVVGIVGASLDVIKEKSPQLPGHQEEQGEEGRHRRQGPDRAERQQAGRQGRTSQGYRPDPLNGDSQRAWDFGQRGEEQEKLRRTGVRGSYVSFQPVLLQISGAWNAIGCMSS